jgi:hypothetical protein
MSARCLLIMRCAAHMSSQTRLPSELVPSLDFISMLNAFSLVLLRQVDWHTGMMLHCNWQAAPVAVAYQPQRGGQRAANWQPALVRI